MFSMKETSEKMVKAIIKKLKFTNRQSIKLFHQKVVNNPKRNF